MNSPARNYLGLSVYQYGECTVCKKESVSDFVGETPSTGGFIWVKLKRRKTSN